MVRHIFSRRHLTRLCGVWASREWRPFKNGARSDDLRLSHWVKTSTDPEAGELVRSLLDLI